MTVITIIKKVLVGNRKDDIGDYKKHRLQEPSRVQSSKESNYLAHLV